jgi:chromosome segregation ATPase
MSTTPPDDESLDERTDELPILVDAALGGEAAVSIPGDAPEDTAEHTAVYRALTPEPDGESAELGALKSDLAARAARIESLEADIAKLGARWAEVETHLNHKDAEIAGLNRTVDELRRALTAQEAAETGLRQLLGERDGELARLEAEARELERSLDAQTSEVERLRRAADAARTEADRVQSELVVPPSATAEETARLRSELSTLRLYVDNRQRWWQAIKARAAAAERQVEDDKRTLGEQVERARRADALAARESERASKLRKELVLRAREAETLKRALAEARSASGTDRPSAARATTPEIGAPAEPPRIPPTTQPAEPIPATRESAESAATLDIISQLEAEVEHKRQQVTAQLAGLRERDERLTGIEDEVDRLRRALRQARMELAQFRADTGRLERALVDKDRSLEARDARIESLQSELADRLGALQKLNAMDASLQGLDSKMSERIGQSEPSSDTKRPALACLTGDAPKQFMLAKPSTTIGRGSQCDIQILTHFVSREHARIAVGPGGVLIEDLGSTNGVFVNSIRIERQELRHGDLITVGETQFRFLESVAN